MPNTSFLLFNAQCIIGSYLLFNHFIKRTEIFLSDSFDGFKKIEAATGTYVKHNIIAPIKAKLKVNAMGLNIFPSTPLNDRIGIKTIKIISCPKMAEFIILEAPLNVISSLRFCISNLPKLFRACCFLVISKAMNSTIITAPSMIIPKSIAPKLIKFASTPKIYINDKAKSKHNGITEATTKPDLKLPNSNTTTKITIKHPKTKFSVTVNVVLAISSLRSKNGLI